MIKWDRNCLEKTNDAMKGEWKTENIRNCAGGTDDPSSYKTSMEKKKAERSVLPIPILGKKEKEKKNKPKTYNTHQKNQIWYLVL